MALGRHFDEEEALAILKLSGTPEWPLLQNYLSRRFILEAKECMKQKELHLIFRGQGASVAFDEMAKLGEKAKNFLEGA